MTDQRFFFNTFKDVTPGIWKANGVSSTQLNVLGIGSIAIHSIVGRNKIEGELSLSCTSQDCEQIYFFIGIATEGGIEVNFPEDKARFTKSGIQILSGQRVGKTLSHLKMIAKNANQTATTASVNTYIPLSHASPTC